jgi:uncharacterized protein
MQKRLGLMLIILCVFLSSLVGAASSSYEAYQRGMAAYKRQDYATALREWRPLAQQGDVTGQFWLGIMYEEGDGVEKNAAEAIRWFQKAAAQGYVYAMIVIGRLYRYGAPGVEKNAAEAIRWFQKAAAQDSPTAKAKLGEMYEEGDGVEKNAAEAHRWYAAAVDGYVKWAETDPTTWSRRRDEIIEARDRLARQLGPVAGQTATQPYCRTIVTRDEDVTQNILNQMKVMSRHAALEGAALTFIGIIAGKRYIQIIGAAASLLSAVFSEAETVAEAKQQPFQLCETTNESGKFVIGPLGVTEEIARGVSTVSPPSGGIIQASEKASDSHGETGLHFTQERINALQKRCGTCKVIP